MEKYERGEPCLHPQKMLAGIWPVPQHEGQLWLPLIEVDLANIHIHAEPRSQYCNNGHAV